MSEGPPAPAGGPLRGTVRDVLIEGDRNIVLGALGRLTLVMGGLAIAPLSLPFRSPPERPRPVDLLLSEYRFVDLSWRESELAQLKIWAQAEPSFGVAGVVGEGGSGKTRLATDLAFDLACTTRPWVVGIIERATQLSDQALQRIATIEGDALVIVDYAEFRVREVAQLIDLALLAPRREGRLRLLVVARGGPASAVESFWNAFKANRSAQEVLRDAPAPIALTQANKSLSDDQREQVWRRANRIFARLLGVPEGAPPRLWREGSANMLALSVMALAAALEPQRGPSSLEDAWSVLIDHEERYWREPTERCPDPPHGSLPQQIVALISLAPPATRQEMTALLQLLSDLEDASSERLGQIADWAKERYPADPVLFAGPAQPDLFAERLIEDLLADGGFDPGRVLEAAATPRMAGRLADALVRTWQSRSAIRPLISERADQIAPRLVALSASAAAAASEADGPTALLLGSASSREVAARIAGEAPLETLARQSVLAATERRLESAAAPASRAALLSNLSVRLAQNGRHLEALAAAQEAVQISLALAAVDQSHRGGLAASLSNLGAHFGQDGRHREALEAEEEAAGIRRELAATDPDVRTELATSLSRLGVHLAENGRHREALEAEEEAVGIRRELATTPGVQADLARSLSNLGIRLAQNGRHPEALAAEQEAISIRRGLASANAGLLPDLARSLSNLGVRLAQSGRHAEALAAEQEATGIRRELASANDGFRADLAWSLSKLSIRLARNGRDVEALEAQEEEVKIRRELAAANHGLLTDLARSLSNLGYRLKAARRPKLAREAYQEAARILSPLVSSEPGAAALLKAVEGAIWQLDWFAEWELLR